MPMPEDSNLIMYTFIHVTNAFKTLYMVAENENIAKQIAKDILGFKEDDAYSLSISTIHHSCGEYNILHKQKHRGYINNDTHSYKWGTLSFPYIFTLYYTREEKINSLLT